MQKKSEKLSINDLRLHWSKLWGIKPHPRIGRVMLEKSFHFKLCENETGGLSKDNQEKLKYYIQQYKRHPSFFDETDKVLKPGARLVRTHRGKKHCVIVKVNGFEYEGHLYNSLSKIAGEITGKNWNGWLFFGLKKVQQS